MNVIALHPWKTVGTPTHEGQTAVGGKLLGKQWQARDLAALFYDAGWHDAFELITALQVCLAESQGFDRAFNDNLDADGNVTSRDVGVCQINIPAVWIGTAKEEALYDVPTNIARARDLFEARDFQPWVAFNSAVYLRDTYVKRAGRGVANYLGDSALQRTPTDTLNGHPYVHTLTTPLFDFEYRVIVQHNAVTAALAACRAAYGATTLTAAHTHAAAARDTLAAVVNAPKQ